MKRFYARLLKPAVLLLGLSVNIVGAHAATATLNFGNQAGNYTPYQEGGYNVSANADGSGSVQLDNSTGQCPFADPSCLHVSGNKPGTAFIERQDFAVFTALSLAIKFSGAGNTNYVSFDNGVGSINLALGSIYSGGVYTDSSMTTLVTGAIVKDTDYFINLSGLAIANLQLASFFNNISELSIETSGGAANVRIDNVSVSAVPLPSAAWLLLAGLGGVGALRLRKRT